MAPLRRSAALWEAQGGIGVSEMGIGPLDPLMARRRALQPAFQAVGLSDPFREGGLHGGELLPAADEGPGVQLAALVQGDAPGITVIVTRAHKPSFEGLHRPVCSVAFRHGIQKTSTKRADTERRQRIDTWQASR